jgi:enamine deaminase RidA (YjgF/YER057c/UK114 family)
MEMDAIAARPTGAGRTVKIRRVPFDKPGTPVVRSVSVGDRVLLSGEVGSDPARNGAIPADVGAQIELAVANIDATLKKSGTSLDKLVKARLFLKNGSADPEFARKKFHEAVASRARHLKLDSIAETLLLVEALDSDQAAIEIGVIARRR